MTAHDPITKEIIKKIEDYHDRYTNPTPATLKKWRKEAEKKAISKNQLKFSFIDDTPDQPALPI